MFPLQTVDSAKLAEPDRDGRCLLATSTGTGLRWSDLHRKRIRTTLERRGARYRGSYTGPSTTQCAGTPATSSVEIEFKVVAARVIGRKRRATRIVGTLDQSEPVQLGCTSSSASHSLRAAWSR